MGGWPVSRDGYCRPEDAIGIPQSQRYSPGCCLLFTSYICLLHSLFIYFLLGRHLELIVDSSSNTGKIPTAPSERCQHRGHQQGSLQLHHRLTDHPIGFQYVFYYPGRQGHFMNEAHRWVWRIFRFPITREETLATSFRVVAEYRRSWECATMQPCIWNLELSLEIKGKFNRVSYWEFLRYK